MESWTGNALVGALEFLEKKDKVPYIELSRLFIYFIPGTEIRNIILFFPILLFLSRFLLERRQRIQRLKWRHRLYIELL